MGEQSRPHLEAMRIVTGCTTAAQFIDVFHRFCDRKTLFIPTTELRPVGSRLAFSLRLADGTPMLRGVCTVREAWASFANAYKRPGVLLALEKLSSESDAVIDQLLAQQTQVRGAPAAPAEVIDDEATTPTEQRPPAQPTPRRSATGSRAPDTRTATAARTAASGSQPPPSRAPGSPIVVPANPLVGMDDAALTAFLDCSVSGDPAAPEPIQPAPLPPPPTIDVAPPGRRAADVTQPTLAPPARDAVRTLQGMPALAKPAKRPAQPPPIPAAARKPRKKADTKPLVG